jgi:hypothetical protein
LAEILRNRRFKGEWFLASRMNEAEFPRVQHLARRGAFRSIKGIANHRMAKMMKVNPDLMSAPTMQSTFHQANRAGRLQDSVFRLCCTAASQVDMHFLAADWVAPDRSFDHSAWHS